MAPAVLKPEAGPTDIGWITMENIKAEVRYLPEHIRQANPQGGDDQSQTVNFV